MDPMFSVPWSSILGFLWRKLNVICWLPTCVSPGELVFCIHMVMNHIHYPFHITSSRLPLKPCQSSLWLVVITSLLVVKHFCLASIFLLLVRQVLFFSFLFLFPSHFPFPSFFPFPSLPFFSLLFTWAAAFLWEHNFWRDSKRAKDEQAVTCVWFQLWLVSQIL